MGRIHITLKTRYEQNHAEFIVCELLSERRLVVENKTFGGKFTITRDELILAWAQGLIRFAIAGPNTYLPPGRTIATQYTFADFNILPEHHRNEAWRRYELLLPLIKLEHWERTRSVIEAYVASRKFPSEQPAQWNVAPDGPQATAGPRKGVTTGKALSRASLERWLQALEQSDYDIRSLVPGYARNGGKDKWRLPVLQEEAIREILAECKARPQYRTVKDVYFQIVSRIVTKMVGEISEYRYDRYSVHELGIHQLFKQLNPAHPLYLQAWAYRQRLLEVIRQARTDGQHETHAGEHTALMAELNVMAMSALGVSFQELSEPNVPSETTVWRRIQRAGAATILRRRRSRVEARDNQPSFPGPRFSRILECILFDTCRLHLIVVDDHDRLPIGPPTIAVGKDGYSGYPWCLSMCFGPPSYHLTMHAMLHGILPKMDVRKLYKTVNPWLAWGIPERVQSDLGPENYNRHFTAACAQLFMIHDRTPVRQPWLKGSIEAFFRDHNSGLIHMLPGSLFSNVVVRGDYDSEKCACISYSGLLELIHVFLVDVFAQEYHEGIDGVPAQLWQDSVDEGFEPQIYHSADELRILMMRSEKRTLRSIGIEFRTLRYQSTDLARLRASLGSDRTVHLKVDPGDLGAIWVLDPSPVGQWLRVPAWDQVYASNLSLWKHEIIRRYVRYKMRRDVDIFALAEAKYRIQQIVEREFSITKGRRRTTAAQLLGIGQGATPSTGFHPLSTAAESYPHQEPIVNTAPKESVPEAEHLSANPPPDGEQPTTCPGNDADAVTSTRSSLNDEIDMTGFSSGLVLRTPVNAPQEEV